MSEWKATTLGEQVNLKRGYDLPSNSRIEGNVPIYSSSGISGFHSEKMSNAPGVITGRYGTIGKVFFSKTPYWPLNTTLYIQDFKGNYELFIYYFLQQLDWEKYSDKSAVPGVNRNDVHQEEIVIPSIPEQKAIAAVLSSLDDKIDLLHRQNKTLEAMAETLFRQWFIEEAKDNWTEGSIGDLLETTFGGDWGKETPEDDFVIPVNCIRGTDIADLQVGLANKIPLRFVKEKKFSSIEPRNGDIIFEISGGTENQSTGRSIYIDSCIKSLFDYPLVFSNFCRLLRPKNTEYTFFIFLYLQYLYSMDDFFSLENGSSGIKNLNYKALLFDRRYLMPDEDKIFTFNKNAVVFFKKINQNKKQIKTLEKIRNSLLPKLMSGELRLSFEQGEFAS